MNYKVLTKAEWQLEYKLMDSGAHSVLNDVIDSKVADLYVADDVAKALQLDAPAQVHGQIKSRARSKFDAQEQTPVQAFDKKDCEVVVFSCFNSAPVVHL